MNGAKRLRDLAWIRKQLSLGLCTICASPASTSSRRYCETHRLAVNARKRLDYSRHVEERLAYARIYREGHRDEQAIRDRTSKYGVTAEWLEEMYDAQERVCAICGADITFRKANVDHDHVTGEARALLCARCNTRLAAVEDRDYLEAALSYLAAFA